MVGGGGEKVPRAEAALPPGDPLGRDGAAPRPRRESSALGWLAASETCSLERAAGERELGSRPLPPPPAASCLFPGGGGGRAAPPGHAAGPPPALLGGAMAKLRVAYEYTEAEDKSIRLGLFLIVSGILSLFILGFCWLSPALQDLQGTAANCTVLSVQQIGELFECTFTCGADCRGTSLYPCLQIYVNNSESGAPALLHQDEHQLLANPKVAAPRAPGRRRARAEPRPEGTSPARGSWAGTPRGAPGRAVGGGGVRLARPPSGQESSGPGAREGERRDSPARARPVGSSPRAPLSSAEWPVRFSVTPPVAPG